MLSLDDLDRRLIHALHVDARAPFSRIAAVLGTSDRTIARRYARLRATPARRGSSPWRRTARCTLRAVAGTHGWPGRTSALTDEEVARLRWQPTETDGADFDDRLLPVLAEDGRADLPTIAKATGWSESTARRRLDQLRRGGFLYFDVDVDPLLLGYASETILWLTVAPSALGTVADDDYLADRLGTLPGLRHVESAPVIRRTKRSTG